MQIYQLYYPIVPLYDCDPPHMLYVIKFNCGLKLNACILEKVKQGNRYLLGKVMY